MNTLVTLTFLEGSDSSPSGDSGHQLIRIPLEASPTNPMLSQALSNITNKWGWVLRYSGLNHSKPSCVLVFILSSDKP
jgi:hypothetical protein